MTSYSTFRDLTTPSQDLRHHDGVSLDEQRAEGIYANAPGRVQALNPLFIAAISLEKYSEARGHIDVACVRGGGALIITYHARKARYASYARGQKRPSHSPPFYPFSLASHTHIPTQQHHQTPALLRRRCCLSRVIKYLCVLTCITMRCLDLCVHFLSCPKGSAGSFLFFCSYTE